MTKKVDFHLIVDVQNAEITEYSSEIDILFAVKGEKKE